MARRAQLGWLVVALVAASPARADDQNSLTIRAPRPAADGQTRTKVELESRRLEAEHLGDVLRSVPGALALDFGGVLATTTISLRGGTADEAAVLLDGVPLGSPAGGGLDLSLVPAALLSQVLVERGADARLGAAAMSGAIELTPAKSSRALLTAGSLGTFGASASLARDFVTDAAWWRATIALDARRSAGDFVYHRDPTPETAGDDPLVTMRRANNDATIRSVLVRVERRAPEGKLSGFAFGTWTDRGLPGPIFSPTPTARQDEKTLVADLDWRTKTLELPLFARTGFLDATGGDAVTLSGEQTYLDVGTKPAYARPLGPLLLRLSGLAGGERFDGTYHGHHTRWRGGLGVEIARERGRLTGSLAGRVEMWGNAVGLLPRLGASVAIERGLYLYANVGGGFRPPSFGELYYSAGPILPNPDLLPERSWTADLGARYQRPGTRLDLEANGALFAGLFQDQIIYEMFSGSLVKPFNLGQARTVGVEGEARASLGEGPLKGLGASTALTLLTATNLVPGPNSYGNDLPYRPRARVDGRLTYARGRVRASAGVDWTAQAFTNTANTRSVAPFLDVRASLGVRVVADAWLSVEVRNALDVTDRACLEGYPLPGRVVLAHLGWIPEER